VLSTRFEILAGKRIFVTGHTGFTGSWVSLWLQQLGAQVYGYALEPETKPSLFTELKLHASINHTIGDIRNRSELEASMEKVRPDLVLHLAAQPLVRRSYRNPVETFDINVQGTVNVLEASLKIASLQGVLCITTDKVYENYGSGKAFREEDRLGGSDPYSASKAAAEIAIASYRKSFFEPASIGLAVARGGNIIGGGDWSEDRLVPDFVRASQSGGLLEVRHPEATRPWQHVLALAEGYISILAGLLAEPEKYSRPFNFGSADEEPLTVSALISELSRITPGVKVSIEHSDIHEAQKLALDSSAAKNVLGWQPRWSTVETIKQTAHWYQRFYAGENPLQLCLQQIESWQMSKSTGGSK
jgi:CDP-glucose 4,6-dehydratase